MHALEVREIVKTFGGTRAVDHTSFTVERGEIFGLLGPNGAGKTTTVRLLLDIFKPDGGSIAVLGGPMTEEKKWRIGYMPEERGLYQDVSLERCLTYLATLKGLSPAEARKRLGEYMDRFDLAGHKRKKVKELSKGMQQKAQIITTIIHGPELIVVDEPFSSLDPVNTQMVKELLRDLRQQGAAVLMSTHQMHQVEELCDRIVLIDRGRNVLYGDLAGIRRRYAGNSLLVRTAGELPAVAGVRETIPANGEMRLILEEDTKAQDVLEALVARRVAVEKFEVALPSLDEIFIRVVAAGGA